MEGNPETDPINNGWYFLKHLFESISLGEVCVYFQELRVILYNEEFVVVFIDWRHKNVVEVKRIHFFQQVYKSN